MPSNPVERAAGEGAAGCDCGGEVAALAVPPMCSAKILLRVVDPSGAISAAAGVEKFDPRHLIPGYGSYLDVKRGIGGMKDLVAPKPQYVDSEKEAAKRTAIARRQHPLPAQAGQPQMGPTSSPFAPQATGRSTLLASSGAPGSRRSMIG